MYAGPDLGIRNIRDRLGPINLGAPPQGLKMSKNISIINIFIQ